MSQSEWPELGRWRRERACSCMLKTRRTLRRWFSSAFVLAFVGYWGRILDTGLDTVIRLQLNFHLKSHFVTTIIHYQKIRLIFVTTVISIVVDGIIASFGVDFFSIQKKYKKTSSLVRLGLHLARRPRKSFGRLLFGSNVLQGTHTKRFKN
jgi:hypothetical protein